MQAKNGNRSGWQAPVLRSLVQTTFTKRCGLSELFIELGDQQGDKQGNEQGVQAGALRHQVEYHKAGIT